MYREFVECSLLHKLELHGSKQAPHCNIIVAMSGMKTKNGHARARGACDN